MVRTEEHKLCFQKVPLPGETTAREELGPHDSVSQDAWLSRASGWLVRVLLFRPHGALLSQSSPVIFQSSLQPCLLIARPGPDFHHTLSCGCRSVFLPAFLELSLLSPQTVNGELANLSFSCSFRKASDMVERSCSTKQSANYRWSLFQLRAEAT